MAATSSTWRSLVEQNGYVVVPGMVPRENLDAVIADIWQHTGARPDDRASWYRPGIISPHGMIEMYHYQSKWDNRQHPRVHEVFADILGTERLWVSLDRVNLKPPADPEHSEYAGTGFIHWDVDISRYPDIPFGVQGVLAVTDTDETMGGFQCVPQLYRDVRAGRATLPAEGASRTPDLAGYAITRVALRAGDLAIWSTLLPHGNGRNVSDRPRLAQYISMHVADEADEAKRQVRVNCWRNRLPPPYPHFPGDPRKIEERLGTPAQLTPLGRKLLGLDSWG
jgi:Phytanoyl-CoA dioxygenase (PhyH)